MNSYTISLKSLHVVSNEIAVSVAAEKADEWVIYGEPYGLCNLQVKLTLGQVWSRPGVKT